MGQRKRKSLTSLAYRREVYRLWFEYLKVARRSEDKRLKATVEKSKLYYEPWGDVFAEPFNKWWERHHHLFEERSIVSVVKSRESVIDPNSLLIEVPLNASPTELIQRIGVLIRAECERRQSSKVKSKKVPTAMYRPTAGKEPKLLAVRESLTIYRDVYLKNRNLKGEKLLNAVRQYYLARKRKSKVPMPLLEAGESVNILKNLRRYIIRAERIANNVAAGEFPGEY